MAKLTAKYNVLNLPMIDYDYANSNNSTISLVRQARSLFDAGVSIPKIAEKIDRSVSRTKELITGVNYVSPSSEYKIIAGVS